MRALKNTFSYILFLSLFPFAVFSCGIQPEPLDEVLEHWSAQRVEKVFGKVSSWKLERHGAYLMKSEKARKKNPNWQNNYVLRTQRTLKYRKNKTVEKVSKKNLRWFHNANTTPIEHRAQSSFLDKFSCTWSALPVTEISKDDLSSWLRLPKVVSKRDINLKDIEKSGNFSGNKISYEKERNHSKEIVLGPNKSMRYHRTASGWKFSQDYEITQKITGGVVFSYKKGNSEHFKLYRIKDIFGSGNYYGYEYDAASDSVNVTFKGTFSGFIQNAKMPKIEVLKLVKRKHRRTQEKSEKYYQRLKKNAY